MKKLSITVSLCLAFFIFQACNDDSSSDAVESANESNEIKQDSASNTGAGQSGPVSEDDSKFSTPVLQQSQHGWLTIIICNGDIAWTEHF